MQTKVLISSLAIAGSSVAFPLADLFGRQVSYGDEATSTVNAPTPTTPPSALRSGSASASFPSFDLGPSFAPEHSATHLPSISGVPERPIGLGEQVTDGYGIVFSGDTSVILCPISHTVKVTSNHISSYSMEEFTLKCPENGAAYEELPTKTGPHINVHGGNLCTSNRAQYYLWSSRMYENLWLTFGSIATIFKESSYCETVDGPNGQVARCLFPSNGMSPQQYYSSLEAHASAVPHATGIVPHASFVPEHTHVSNVPSITGTPFY